MQIKGELCTHLAPEEHTRLRDSKAPDTRSTLRGWLGRNSPKSCSPNKRARDLGLGLDPNLDPPENFSPSSDSIQLFSLERGGLCFGVVLQQNWAVRLRGREGDGPNGARRPLLAPPQPQQLADERTQAKQPSAE